MNGSGVMIDKISIEVPDDLVYMRYAPITLVDVKKSFSMYKHTLEPNKLSFSENNLYDHIFVF